jgi:hypothetical protein
MLMRLNERKDELVICITNTVSHSFETSHALKTTNFQPYSKRTDLPRGTEVSGARGTPPDRIDDEMDPMDGGRFGSLFDMIREVG